MKRLNKRGFTLVEIMIVVAIIALLVAIAIPNLLRARHNANEAAAIAALRTASTAFESYRAAQTPPTYPPDGATLAAATPPYIDATLATALDAGNARQGYDFALSGIDDNAFTIDATPDTPNVSGTREFQVTESGVITLDDGTPVE